MAIVPKSAPTIEESLEPGFVFDPSDQDLVIDYLHRWICFQPLPCDIVILDDVYRTEPWNLLTEYKRQEDGGYFLTQIKGKASDNASTRRNRQAGEGSYTIQRKEGVIDESGIAWQKTTFNYQRKVEGEKKRKRKTSGWVMYEYEITSAVNEWVLCRVKLSDQEISRSKRRKESAIVVVADQHEHHHQFEEFSSWHGQQLVACDHGYVDPSLVVNLEPAEIEPQMGLDSVGFENFDYLDFDSAANLLETDINEHGQQLAAYDHGYVDPSLVVNLEPAEIEPQMGLDSLGFENFDDLDFDSAANLMETDINEHGQQLVASDHGYVDPSLAVNLEPAEIEPQMGLDSLGFENFNDLDFDSATNLLETDINEHGQQLVASDHGYVDPSLAVNLEPAEIEPQMGLDLVEFENFGDLDLDSTANLWEIDINELFKDFD